jgi:glycosyltransferase 2 family protein
MPRQVPITSYFTALMKSRIVTVLQYLLFLGLGIFLVWWSISKMSDEELQECKDALASARYILIIPVFIIISASHISRAMRWKLLMKPLGYNPGFLNTFFAVMAGYLANLAFPRLGEVLKCTILARYEKVPADKLVGTILVERVVDVMCLLAVFTITIFTQYDLIGQFAKDTIREHFLEGGIRYLMIKAGILLAVLILLYYFIKYIFRYYSHHGFIVRIKSLVEGVRAGLTSVGKMENKWLFIFHSVFIWCCYVGGTYLGFYATAGTDHLPFMVAFPVLAFASIGMIITPGGIGAYPKFIQSVMVLYGVNKGIAYANGTLQWMAQCVIILVVGFICVAVMPYFNKKKIQA